MQYVSTRGGAAPQNFCDILLEGLASDGGLFLPERYPAADLTAWRALGYPQLAFEILSRFIDDIPGAALRAMVERTYTAQVFGSAEVAPLRTLEPGLHLLGLSNGPTLAFKDIALQLLGNLFEHVLAGRDRPDERRLNILGATSGDTGSSAEYALRGKRGIQVFMLSPDARMSAFQRAQMYSLQDANIHNLAVQGVFDDCQDLVKAVNADAGFKAKYRIGAVNSINWARIAAQVVYYFWGYFRATRTDGEQVSFAVPSGNFGNIYAGHVARSMGLPIRQLLVATNENDVLHEFFASGRYRARRAAEVRATSSPSMDISKASNFERYAFDLIGRDAARLKALWGQLEAQGGFTLSGPEHVRAIAQTGFAAGRSTHQDRLATIRRVHRRYGVIIDPHTADGVKVGLDQRVRGVPLICLETAQPAKFADTIREALGIEPPRPAGLEDLERRPQRVERIAPDVAEVKRIIAGVASPHGRDAEH